mgnify:CR=1 FL=1
MLNIIYGDIERDYPEIPYMYTPGKYFDANKKDEWLMDDLSKEMILDVDKSEVVGPNLIMSEVLGPIPPHYLSEGVKTLILINNDTSHVFNASSCGDNCAKWLLKMGEQKDITINLRHIMHFGTQKEGKEFEINIVNEDMKVYNQYEFLLYVIDKGKRQMHPNAYKEVGE